MLHRAFQLGRACISGDHPVVVLSYLLYKEMLGIRTEMYVTDNLVLMKEIEIGKRSIIIKQREGKRSTFEKENKREKKLGRH